MNLTKRRSTMLDIAGLRLPLVAMVDVVLFLLFYFIIAGNLADEEADLSSTLDAQRQSGVSAGVQPQVLVVEPALDGGVVFRIGERTVKTKATLVNLLSALPKEPGISVKVDPRLTVEFAAMGVQAARDAGFTKITYLAGQ